MSLLNFTLNTTANAMTLLRCGIHSISLEQSAVWMAPADSCLETDKLASAHGIVKQIKQIRQESLTESRQMFDCSPLPVPPAQPPFSLCLTMASSGTWHSKGECSWVWCWVKSPPVGCPTHSSNTWWCGWSTAVIVIKPATGAGAHKCVIYLVDSYILLQRTGMWSWWHYYTGMFVGCCLQIHPPFHPVPNRKQCSVAQKASYNVMHIFYTHTSCFLISVGRRVSSFSSSEILPVRMDLGCCIGEGIRSCVHVTYKHREQHALYRFVNQYQCHYKQWHTHKDKHYINSHPKGVQQHTSQTTHNTNLDTRA